MSLTTPSIPEPQSLDEAREIIAGAREVLTEFVGVLGAQKQRIEKLEAQVDELRVKAGLGSGNSSKPPSSDSAAQRATRREQAKGRKKGSGKRRGAQPGHDKHERAVVAPEALDAAHDYLPNALCGCGCGCGGDVVIDAEPRCRHQVFDLPEVAATVVEHRLYSGVCAGCGQRHAAQTPTSVPSGQMGPGLIAFIAVLSGKYHLSTRKIQAYLVEHWGRRVQSISATPR